MEQLPPEPCVCQSREDTIYSPISYEHEVHWRPDHTCSFCGSLEPEYLIWRLALGTATLEWATGKSYKLYVHAVGEPFGQWHRPTSGPEYEMGTTTHAKFYLWHSTAEQRARLGQILQTPKSVH